MSMKVSEDTKYLTVNGGGTSSNILAKVNVPDAPAKLIGVHCTNGNGAVRYLQIHNKATAVANPDVPLLTFPMAATSGSFTLGRDLLGPGGLRFSLGITVAVSTTAYTYTAATASDHVINITYQ